MTAQEKIAARVVTAGAIRGGAIVKFTQQMSMHLNGGSKFSELHFNIFADGQPTGITRRTRTDGSPHYYKTIDMFTDGNETFDVLATRGTGMEAWLTAHVAPRQEVQS